MCIWDLAVVGSVGVCVINHMTTSSEYVENSTYKEFTLYTNDRGRAVFV